MMFYRATGAAGAIGCGLAFFCLGLFLLTPVAVFLLKGVGWTLVVLGIMLAAIGVWTWWKSR
ncbi:MAG: hypothetical protein OXL37_03885 [Chloroflexota bacterium]|nr:hypothetical protein [Chloroflexota bacterium]MDE2958541.1 hypothetical protein [Chloroflexota bacterium]